MLQITTFYHEPLFLHDHNVIINDKPPFEITTLWDKYCFRSQHYMTNHWF